MTNDKRTVPEIVNEVLEAIIEFDAWRDNLHPNDLPMTKKKITDVLTAERRRADGLAEEVEQLKGERTMTEKKFEEYVEGSIEEKKALQSKLHEAEHFLKDHSDDVVRTAYQKIKGLEGKLQEAEKEIKSIEERERNYLEKIGQDTKTIKELQLKFGLLENEVERLRNEIRAYELDIYGADAGKVINDQKKEIKELEARLAEREKEIEVEKERSENFIRISNNLESSLSRHKAVVEKIAVDEIDGKKVVSIPDLQGLLEALARLEGEKGESELSSD